jgi:hypothetical protein
MSAAGRPAALSLRDERGDRACYTDRVMGLRGGRRLVLRWCATVLLLWTAIDVMAPGLCALEREHEENAVSAASADETAAPDRALPPTNDSTSAPHVDDCFCCSHCVDIWRLDAVGAPADLVQRFVVHEQRPADFIPPPPYHPPLA